MRITRGLLISTLLLAACGGSTVATSTHSPTPSAHPQSSAAVNAASPSPTAAPESPSPTASLFVFAPEAGSTVGGAVQLETGSGGVTLTATVSGLKPGRAYIVDADPLPCEIFALGPSQSFAKPLVADANGNGRVVWTVPTGMDGSASVQDLTSQGTYEVLACADLAS